MIKTAGLILLAALTTMQVEAQNNRQSGRGMCPLNEEGSYAGLDLTETQKEELSTLRTEHYKTMKPLRAKMAEFRARERSLLAEEAADLKAIEKVIDQETELMNKMRKEQLSHRLAMKDILSDEQVMKLEQRRQHAAHMRQGRKGPGDSKAFGKKNRSGYGRGFKSPGRG